MDLKNMNVVRKMMHAARWATGLLTPKVNTYLNYYGHNRRLPNLNEPKSFSEKLLKLKLENYNSNPLVKKCADKVSVREYVRERGYGAMLNEVLGVYSDPDDIPWGSLGDRFVVKLNTGAGCNLICSNIADLDLNEAKRTVRSWKKVKPWVLYSEYQYKTRKQWIVEKYLDISSDGVLPEDYKVYCFGGKAKAILCISGRFSSDASYGYFMSPDWQFMGSVNGKDYRCVREDGLPPKPDYLRLMIDAAEALSVPFPFVRVDFYIPEINSYPIFGEMTFTPAGGVYTSETLIEGKSMGELLDIHQS
ncbi:ATP-grasp fold amidoligase family protein [uncultured Slackia sp.]|uniref:ATP-grasp fold amidoligase family protein n=1 Tax=uncultured Slackia sp. TaxID=665903 RepID=UPI00261A1FF3|nr:ATP-grasp fold amidoligase family protein [uncultured Slackia sp.]